jgi:hypothetical protein
MTDEERALTSIGLLDLSNGRTFKFNGRIEQIARDELAKGVPWEDIVAAARYVGNTIEERDRMPSLTPEKKMSANITKLAVLKLAEAQNQAEEQKRIEKSRQETERLKLEMAARAEIKRDEAAALRERTDWEDWHGSNCDGFVSTNPTALYRADLEARIEQAYRDHSGNYSVLRVEATKLGTEALEARMEQR